LADAESSSRAASSESKDATDAKSETDPKGRRRAASARKSRGRPSPTVRTEIDETVEAERRAERDKTRRRAAAVALSRPDLESLSKALEWKRPASQAPAAPPKVPAKRLHVVMAGWEFPPQHTGGLGVHCYELTRELTRMGHRVTFLTPFQGPFASVPGVTFRWPGGPNDPQRTYPPSYWSGGTKGSPFSNAMDGYNAWIASLTDLKDADILHVHDWFGTVGTRELAKRIQRPLVMTIHSTEYDRSLGFPGPDILYREKVGLQAADRVIAVSRHLKKQLATRYQVPGEKVRVIYNAVRPSDRLARLQRSEQIVLYLGRLAAMKGVDTFLRASARVAPLAPGTLFVVAGEGPEYPHLLTLAAHLGIADRVMFLGRVTEEERSVLLASSSVFVLPSVVEPFGIVALEAMAAGVPTIVSKTSGVVEITDSVFAVDFWDVEEFASRIAELLHYPVLRDAMGEIGRWEALRQGWPERALETVGVYAELLEPSALAT
jgi:glycosyltransferase involved in cell wall biosynthesis